MKLLWKLLREHVSVSQLLGFLLSNLIGMVIVLLSLQIYCDLQPLLSRGDSFMKSDYLIVSKQVSSVGSLLGKNHTFSQQEIHDIENQKFTSKIGQFTTSQFDIYVSLQMPDSDMQISSDIFFESVEDEFVDVHSNRWHFSEGDDVIPIIMPRNYLNLYNFGFSQSRNLPKISEGAISLLNLKVRIRGHRGSQIFSGNIVGFSDRLNTILVPQSFMEWANSNFCAEPQGAPTRLILEVKNPADESIAQFFADNKYSSEDDKLDAGKITHLLRWAIYAVMLVGLFISLLSLYILMLSVFLLLEKNSTKIENLLLLGYTPRRVARPYQLLTAAVNAVDMLIALAAARLLRGQYIEMIDTLFPTGELPSMLPIILLAIALAAIVTAVNAYLIRVNVRRFTCR
ncbi:MAG: ABC transporter permease [Rikenellaceae bacterium]